MNSSGGIAMNPMSLPRATLFTIGALVLALIGWGALIYATASHRNAEQRWTEQRTGLETTLAEERKAAGDLAGLRAQIDTANAKLNDRMAVLGEREQNIAAAESDLSGLQQQLSTARAESDRAKAQVSQRMTLLGERERDLAQLQRQQAKLNSDAESAQARLSAVREGLNQRLAVLGERERDLEKLRRAEATVADQVAAREERLAELRDQLNGRMVVLREREHDLADRRMQLASLSDEEAQVEGRINAAVVRLNKRMGVLGERDRDLAATNQALSALTARIDQTEQRHASATAQLNERLAVLRDNERQAAELARVVMRAGGQLARLEEAAAAAQANLLNQQTALAAAQVNLAEAERTLSHHGVEIARTSAQLEEAQTRLASLEGQVDHTLLAKATGELSGRRDVLAKEVAALDLEIEQKGPLAASATTLSTRVAELEDQLLRLTREREQAAAAVRDAHHQLDMVQADRAVAEREHARLAKQVNELDARKEETEGALASLNADVRQQDSVFATLEVLKKEQGFLRELIGAMLDDGSAARERIRELRQESETLLAQQLELEKDVFGKQTEIQMLDKEIVAKNRSLEGKEPDVSNARSF
jgi:chromosome segregation ATPase